MKKLILFSLLSVSQFAFADAKVWLVKCEASATPTPQVTADALKAAGVNVLSTVVTKEVRLHDDLCGQGGSMSGYYLRQGDVLTAKAALVELKDAPQGFPGNRRHVH